MRAAVYVIAFGTNLTCAVLLLRAYRRVTKRLLLWSGLCFSGLALSSGMVFVDLVLFPATDLFLIRLVLGVAAMGLLVYGLVFEEP